jgi:hypothetical protein
MIVGKCVNAEGPFGMMEASTTPSRSVPCTRPEASTTAPSSGAAAGSPAANAPPADETRVQAGEPQLVSYLSKREADAFVDRLGARRTRLEERRR